MYNFDEETYCVCQDNDMRWYVLPFSLRARFYSWLESEPSAYERNPDRFAVYRVTHVENVVFKKWGIIKD
jgi:hypothetical protein